jgi:hypothetical protein
MRPKLHLPTLGHRDAAAGLMAWLLIFRPLFKNTNLRLGGSSELRHIADQLELEAAWLRVL